MITTLHIENIGIIDDLTIDFNKGLNVLTGETGSGKSLIIDSLIILCGGRFSKEMIRKGQVYSFVEACIYHPKSKYSEEGNIIVSREIHTSGKNLCKVNGRLVTVSILKEIMLELVDIHAQNDNHNLMNSANHIKYLDNYIDEEIKCLKSKYSKLYEEYNKIFCELNNNYGNEQEKQRTLDLLTYQLNEIENANLSIGEEENLEKDLKIIQSYEKIYTNINNSCKILNSNVISGLENVIICLSKIESIDSEYKEKLNVVKGAYYDIQDVSSNLNSRLYDTDYENINSEEVVQRLDLIYSLKRKYGNSIEEVLNYKEDIEKQIDNIVNLEEYNNMLKIKLENLRKDMNILCQKMHDIRMIYAEKISSEINMELKDLEMENATFKVNVVSLEKFNKNGLDEVEFVISTNVGEDFKQLTKIASGGEISRIMLAIKVVLANVDTIPVMIFDEIDTGISGTAAKAVSEKMKKISSIHQLICITHLAVITAKADYNYLIKKEVSNNNTKTFIKTLNESETLMEIARISSGEITDIALKHALELRNLNKMSA